MLPQMTGKYLLKLLCCGQDPSELGWKSQAAGKCSPQRRESRGAWKNPLVLELVTKARSGKWGNEPILELRVQIELEFRIKVDLSKEQLKLLGLKD